MPETKTVEVEILSPAEAAEFRLEEARTLGEVSVHGRRNAVADRAPASPGSLMTHQEAVQRAGALEFDDETNARIGAALANLQGEDEISNDMAAAFLAQRRGADAHAPVVDEVIPEPVEPNTLPATISQAMQWRDPDWKPEAPIVEPRWALVYDTPRYLQEQIRGLGRTIFRSFPCFARHQQETAGNDPLGMISYVACFDGRGPSRPAEVQAAARYIRDNGVVVDNAVLEFPTLMPNYKPRVVLAVTDEMSMLLVEERVEDGCPVNGQAIYAWKGGRTYYLANPEAALRLGGMEADPNRPRQIGAPRRALPAPGGRPAAPAFGGRARPVLPAVPVAPMTPGAVLKKATPAERRAKLAAMPVAPQATTSDVVLRLRKEGFLPSGSMSGPILQKAIGDGRKAVVHGESGKSLAASAEFTLTISDDSGDVLSETTLRSADDVEDALAPASGSPAP